jgi:hypothetical protein
LHRSAFVQPPIRFAQRAARFRPARRRTLSAPKRFPADRIRIVGGWKRIVSSLKNSHLNQAKA